MPSPRPGLPPEAARLAAGAIPGPPKLLDSAGFRHAVVFAALFASAFTVLLAILWWQTAGAVDRQTDAAIRADTFAFTQRHREAGAAGLVREITERLATDVNNDLLVLLLAPGGARITGNVEQWPAELAEADDWARVTIERDRGPAEARVLTTRLGAHRLLVGRDETEREALRGLLAQGLLWASGVVFVFGLFGAALLRQMLEQRLRPAFATTAAIAGGDLGARVPVSGRGDEFDRLAATLNAMLDRIAALMQGVRGVSDAIAHDLRTPIARARAKLEEALGAAPPGEASRAAVEQGIADLDGITRVFEALLRIAEAEAGARRAAFAEFDLVPVLADAAEFYAVAAEARGQRLTTTLPARLPMLGDRDLLLQSVANLLDNAIKFTPAGGAIVLEARDLAAAVELMVGDDGPGLGPADRAQAGERFFRADEARATPGSGLGLSLVRAVAALHGGRLELDDAEPGRTPPGLRARLVLPAPRPQGLARSGVDD